jgi:hypothetical protein
MSMPETYTAFAGSSLVASGDAADVAEAARAHDGVLIFADESGEQVELDARTGQLSAGRAAPLAQPARPGRGRPKLGVVAREVTLLPRHWDWLAAQPGGASAALRRLVEDARRSLAGADRVRQAQQAVYSVMSALGGDLPGFEAAARALYAGDDAGFDAIVEGWPEAIGDYVFRLAAAARAARAAVSARA